VLRQLFWDICTACRFISARCNIYISRLCYDAS